MINESLSDRISSERMKEVERELFWWRLLSLSLGLVFVAFVVLGWLV